MASAQSLTRSEAAFKARASEVGLTADEVKKLFDHGVTCMAKLAFAACPPGQNPTDDQVNPLFGGGLSIGSLASAKELIFESQTLVVAELKNRVEKGDEAASASMAAAERDTRIAEQRKRSTGLTRTGDEECSYESYNLVHTMIQQNTVLYHHPERFATRQFELQQRRPRKELTLDAKSGVVVRDKALELRCETHTELELTQAFRRRALAYDLTGACSYSVMNAYHHYLIQRLQETPPPNYMRITSTQVLRADRAAFTRIAEQVKSVRREADGTLPLCWTRPCPFICCQQGGRKGKQDRSWKGGKGPRAPKELIGKVVTVLSPAKLAPRAFTFAPSPHCPLRDSGFMGNKPEMASAAPGESLQQPTQVIGDDSACDTTGDPIQQQVCDASAGDTTGDPVQQQIGEVPAGDTTGDPVQQQSSRDDRVHPAEQLAETLLFRGRERIRREDVDKLLDLLPDTDMQRGDRTEARGDSSKCFISGGQLWVADDNGVVDRSGQRSVIVGFTPRNLEALSEADRTALSGLGFRLHANAVAKGPTCTAKVPAMVEGEADLGVYRTPQEFLEEALKAKHPSHLDALIPEDLMDAIRSHVELSEEALSRVRTERIREWISWAQDLQAHEDMLKQDLPAHRKLVLGKKRLCLFKRVLQQADHGDVSLVNDITSGFSLTGRLPEAGILRSDFRPASQPVSLLREGAKRSKEAVLAERVPSESDIVDRGVEEATLKELEKGFIEGQIASSRIGDGLPELAAAQAQLTGSHGISLRAEDRFTSTLQEELLCIGHRFAQACPPLEVSALDAMDCLWRRSLLMFLVIKSVLFLLLGTKTLSAEIVQEWLQVVLPWAGITVLGMMLSAAADQAEKIAIVTQTLGGKALSTLEKRSFPGLGFALWGENAPASRIKGVLELVAFLRHVVGLPVAENAGDSPWIRGILRSAAANAKPTSKARPLTVGEVSALEEFVKRKQGALQDVYAAGCFLYLIYSRARFGDCKIISNVFFDLIKKSGDVVGYVEVISWSHKMRRHFPSIPLVAPVQGATKGSWVERWRAAAAEVGLPFERLQGDARGPLLPLPSKGGWHSASCSTAEARAWLSQLLVNLGHTSGTTVGAHSCKATCLSWCSKFGISKEVRTRLGNHNDRGSAECYGRDTFAGPLRDLEGCVLAIRTGAFLPDMSRSGYFPADASSRTGGSSSPVEAADVGVANSFVLPASDPVGESSCGSPGPLIEPASPSLESNQHGDHLTVRSPATPENDAAPRPEDQPNASESSSSSTSSSTDSEVESEPGPHLAALEAPEWRSECEVWQHRQSRTVHLLPVADADAGAFVCGRAKSKAYTSGLLVILLSSRSSVRSVIVVKPSAARRNLCMFLRRSGGLHEFAAARLMSSRRELRYVVRSVLLP
ncbi:unnamed protein product [Symbiodinium sp. CCMP2456]|nr:unnamed protein product [Symbiodinium sp. CCMP2456]